MDCKSLEPTVFVPGALTSLQKLHIEGPKTEYPTDSEDDTEGEPVSVERPRAAQCRESHTEPAPAEADLWVLYSVS